MESRPLGWWHRNGWTLAILLFAFGAALSIRTVWAYPEIARWGPLFTYAGGSDSYYHSRVMAYIIQTNHNLVYDPMLKFPVGAINPREPLFDWMNAVLGIVFAPFFGGNAIVAGSWFLSLQGPLWAALTVFPIYLIGRELSGRRTGLIAAVVFPFFSASINSSTFGYANYLSYYTFVLLVVVYSFMRTVKAVGSRRWIENYADRRQYLPGLRAFLRTERTAVKWAVFTGVAFGTLALSWQGYTYAVVVIGFGVIVSMIVGRIRRVDSFGLYVVAWIVGLVGFPMMAPYYLVQHDIRLFLELPVLLYFGVLLLLLPFLLMRDVPWVFSIPFLGLLIAGAAVGLRLASPAFFTSLATGQGYFVKNLIYSTIAEAQAPSIDQLIIGYGVVTFFLAFVGLAISLYLLVHQRFPRHQVVFAVFAIVSVYLPISATKFFLVGTPAFALLSAEAIHRALDVGGYPELRRTVASLSDRGSRFAAFRKAFRARHVLVLALVVGLLLPNVWISVDAGIPGNTKNQLAAQINSTLPSWLKLNSSAPASSYLGAAGTSLDTPADYDSAAYTWLSQQDTNVPEPNRPAFVSWWDYGFQAIDQGEHPSVADNFQNGIDPAGQFLLAQNESLAIGVLAATLLQGEIQLTHLVYLPPALNAVLAADGLNLTKFHSLLVNESADYALVVANPARYLPVDPATITNDNAMYLAVSYYLADTLPVSGVAKVYDDLEAYTGWSIRYAMTDSRLFPFSGSNTGIFYAPADLTGRVISSVGVPSAFYSITVLGTDGNTYPLGQLPATVAARQYNINYNPAFYDSMIFRIYIGYNGTDVGQSGGIPGLLGAAQPDPLEPGWMLQHFEVVYKTAFYCPHQKNASTGSGCFRPTNQAGAAALANATNGTADVSPIPYFQGGETMLAYYPGQTFLGTVALPDGSPDPGVRVTVYDGWGIPHMSSVTASDGTFSLILPPGNDTLNVTTGSFNGLTQADTNVLRTLHLSVPSAVGYSTDAPAVVRTITVGNGAVAGVVYWNVANNSSFVPTSDPPVKGARVVFNGPGNLSSYSAVTDQSGSYSLPNLPPTTYSVTVRVAGITYNSTARNVSSGTTTSASIGLSPAEITGTVSAIGGLRYGGATVQLSDSSGVVASTTTGPTGTFLLLGLAPGTYSIAAIGASPGLRSPTTLLTLAASGHAVEGLTIEPMGAASVEVVAAGSAVPNVPVRFVPSPTFSRSTTPALTAVANAASNGTFATTDEAGFAGVSLPPGNYTVSALGMVGSVLEAGVAVVNAVAGFSGPPLLLSLTPATLLSGSVAPAAGGTGTNQTAVLVYTPAGAALLTWVTKGGTYGVYLPHGDYTVLALRGGAGLSLPTSAALVAVNVSGPTSLDLTLLSAINPRFVVGTPVGARGFYGASDASVSVSSGASGPSVPASAAANGTVGFFLPATAPFSTDGYCVRASALGFAPNVTCGISPTTLSGLARFPLALELVPTTLTVVGLPSGTSVTVNLTAESPTAKNVTATGGSSFSFLLPPGQYGVGARAVIGNGTVVYLPPSVQSTAIPFGATSTALTLIVLPEITARGTLTVPPGVTLGGATVTLASRALNVTVSGSTFVSGFRATTGSYTATVRGSAGATTYVTIARVSIAANGTVSPSIHLTGVGIAFSGTLQRPSGRTLIANTTLTFVSPTGGVVPIAVANGTFSATLPSGGPYAAYANVTEPSVGPNGSFLEEWATAPGASCSFSPNATSCFVPMVGTIPRVTLNGTLITHGVSGSIPGTVRLVGPYPSTSVTVVAASNGSFSTSVAPGAYGVYASATGGPTLSGFARVLLVAGGSGNASFLLTPGWNAAISLLPANVSGETVGPANVTVKDAFGNFTVLPGVPIGSTTNLSLAPGVYTVVVSAPGSLHGVNGSATASSTFRVSSGNQGVVIAPTIPLTRTVSASLVGPTAATVAAGGTVSFSFTVRDTGNVPVTVRPVGAPALFRFNFTFANATVQPGGAPFSGEVRVTVPSGTSVNHPALALTFELADGSEVGAVTPAPTVTVLPYYGVVARGGPASSVAVGPARATVPFTVENSGNAFENVRLVVVDGSRLSTLGWTAGFLENGRPLSANPVGLSEGTNTSFSVNLSTTALVPLPPGSVTISATVQGVNGSFTSTVTINVPTVTVQSKAGSTYVTGPSVGAGPPPLPDWFVPLVSFVPAIALVVGLSALRWWRTRRWTRR